jgi:hypothetical protein
MSWDLQKVEQKSQLPTRKSQSVMQFSLCKTVNSIHRLT